jgi:Concanavalin A-like lectin/glucanases superfamily
MPAATSNVVSVSLLSISPVEALQSAGALVSGAMSAFLPPSGTAVETLQSAGAVVSGTFTEVDPDFADVALLLNMDGTEGQTTFTDLSENNFPISQSGFTPLVFVDTTNPKFGTGAADFGSGIGNLNGLDVAITPGGPLDLQLADFTIEGWFIFNSSSFGGGLLSDARRPDTAGKWLISVTGSSVQFLGLTTPFGVDCVSPTVTYMSNTWYSFAVVLHNGVMTIYLNGIGGAPIPVSGSVVATAGTLSIGGCPAEGGIDGEMDEVRISNIARYTSNYTPATAPFPTS